MIIPAFNEEQSLSELTERVVQILSNAGFSAEVIIVNDGSTDGTREVADALTKKYEIVKVFHHRRNLGKSASLRTGFDKARGAIIVMLDADLQYAPEDIPKLVGLINKGYDVVNGWRKSRSDSLGRKVSSSFYNFLTRQIFGLTIRDFNSGLKAFRREVVEDIETTGLRSDFHRYL
ncbi:MAG: glycosyltransferase family 2 protein, partial [Candidatus Bathyarchaeia archaeon]